MSTEHAVPDVLGLWVTAYPYVRTIGLCVLVIIALLALMYSISKLGRMLWAASVIVLKTVFFVFIVVVAIIVIIFAVSQLSNAAFPPTEELTGKVVVHLQRGRAWVNAVLDFVKSNVTVKV